MAPSPEPGGRPDYPQMGERLRAARTARGLSLRELAGRLAVSPSLISQIETGRSNPSVSTLYAIADELDVSLDELLFNDRRPAEPMPAAARPDAPDRRHDDRRAPGPASRDAAPDPARLGRALGAPDDAVRVRASSSCE